jgi:hypothetical protein
VELERERGDDAEVAATAPESPEEVGIRVVAGCHEATIGCDDVGCNQIVKREPVATRQVTEASAEC